MDTDNNSPGVSNNPTHVLMRKLQENKNSLHINYVPTDTKELFIRIANEEFDSHYGLFLKYLIDKAIDYDSREIRATLREHEERIKSLEEQESKSPNGVEIKTLGGKIIKRGG